MRPFNPTKSFDEVVGARRSLARVSDVFGKVSPKSLALVGAAPSMGSFFRGINESRPTDVPDHIGTIIGAAVGGIAMRSSHPVLGVIGGASLGRNLPALMDDDLRKIAIGNMVQTGAAVAASAYAADKNSLVSQALWFGAGWVGGGLACYLVRGLR